MPTALVTGASSGIGLELARALAARGHDLVVVARSLDKLEDLAASMSVGVEVIAADLASDAGMATIEDRLQSTDRPIDLLVNNAGFGTTGKFAELPIEGEVEEIRLNVLALTRLTGAAVPQMVARGHGAVINVASIAAFQPTPGTATYGATKAFVLSFTMALREELRGTGVRAVALCPGFTRTGFQERANFELKGIAKRFSQTADEVAQATLRTLDRDAGVCVPGWQNKVAAGATHLAPRKLVPRIARMISGQV